MDKQFYFIMGRVNMIAKIVLAITNGVMSAMNSDISESNYSGGENNNVQEKKAATGKEVEVKKKTD